MSAPSADVAACEPGSSIAAAEIVRTAAELVTCGSLEMGADTPEDARRIGELLPAGTPVYVTHLPKRHLGAALDALVELRQANLEPVPHIAARRIFSRAEAEDFIRKAVRRAGVTKVLLVAGDVPEPLGPYPDSAAFLAEDFLRGCGLTQVGLAGYPEGHPRIPTAALYRALERKLELATGRGLEAHLVTQFSFAPNRIVEYCADIARRAPGVPVYVGLAGPTSPAALLRFAQRCGVSASLRALQAEGVKAVRLFTHVDPTDQLMALAGRIRSGSARNVMGVHLYSFGGAVRTAQWMHARITARA
ncbi:MAG TPA: methylenetetrahydrofolate reductase [Hyphomicrobiaceae bacterium]|jgi:methylenetetrahydrofolate reductase (NADPH)|nr:methylenetetrahydrofolate reductase [Hyphomicrobiaceae bacterium]